MVIIGITGTDGKTTSSTFTAQLLELCGYKVGLFCTNSQRIAGVKQKNLTKRTTPSPFFLYRFLKKCYKAGCTHVVLEVSAHALSQRRVFGICFDVVCITNLTREHGDYYPTMDIYAREKAKLFHKIKKENIQASFPKFLCVVHASMNFRKYFDSVVPGKTILFRVHAAPFATNRKSDSNDEREKTDEKNFPILEATIIETDVHKTSFSIQYKDPVGILSPSYSSTLHVAGSYNVNNALLACCVGFSLGIPLENMANAIQYIKPVEGRMQQVNIQAPFRVFIDYAVTPDALEKVLTYARNVLQKGNMLPANHKETGTGNVRIVFGCTGGNRDHSKRPYMGKVAFLLADHVVLTEDEAYGEPVEHVLPDIFWGILEVGTVKEMKNIHHMYKKQNEAGVLQEKSRKRAYPCVAHNNKECPICSSMSYIQDCMQTTLHRPDKTTCEVNILHDRKNAIIYALQHARENDIVIISGMADEPTRNTLQGEIKWSDEEIVKERRNTFLKNTEKS